MPEYQPTTTTSETYEIIRRLLLEMSKHDVIYPDHMTSSTLNICNNLRRLVTDLMDRHAISFRGICNLFKDIDDQEVNDLEAFRAIGQTLFEDGGCTTWGRVLSLIALACCAMRTRQESRPDKSKQIAVTMASSLSKYLDGEFESDMRQLGGWDSLGREFPDPNLLEGRVKKLFFGSILVLGACSLKAILTN